MSAQFGPLDSSEVCVELSGVLDKLMTHLWLVFEGATGLLVGLEVVVVEAVVVVGMLELVVVVVVQLVVVSLVGVVELLSHWKTLVVVVREELGVTF